MRAVDTPMQDNKIVAGEESPETRKANPAKGEEFTRLPDELGRERPEMIWPRVEKDQLFPEPNGKETLGELFDGLNDLIVHRFIAGPGDDEGCPGSSPCPIILMAPLFI